MASIDKGRRHVLGYALAIIVGVLAMCGCASISTFQTARTLKPSESQKGVGVTVGNPRISESWGEWGVQELRVHKSPVYPWPEFWLRKGLSENLDWGIKTWGPFFGAIADLKYQFLSDESPWQVAGSLGLGFSNRLETLEEGFAFFDIYLPFFISKDFAKHSSFYISPKYIHRILITGNSELYELSNHCNAFGAGLGISFPLSSRFLIGFLPIFGELDLGSMMIEYDCVYETGTVVGLTHNCGVAFASKIKKRKN